MHIRTFVETRKHRNQAEWARHFGITRGYLNQLVAGNKVPSLAMAVAIHHATEGLVTPFDWLDSASAWAAAESEGEATHHAGSDPQ